MKAWLQHFMETVYMKLPNLVASALIIAAVAVISVFASTPPSVESVTVQKKKVVDVLVYPAKLLPKVQATLVAEQEGIVSKVNAFLGKTVSRKEVLAEIQKLDPVYDYRPSKVEAPIHGIVSSLDISQGNSVTKGQKLIQIINPDSLYLQIELTGQDAEKVKVGDGGYFQLESGDKFPVSIRGLSPQFDPQTGTLACDLEFRATTPALRSGQVGKVTFEINPREAIQVPETALIYRDTSTFVRAIEESKIKWIPVEVLSRDKNLVSVKGLPEGASIVPKTSQFLSDGEVVTEIKP